MSITVNAALLKSQFSDSNIATISAEVVLDGGINMLNVFEAGIPNLTGAAESKTGTYTSAQTGAIMAMAQQIYQKHFKNASGANAQVASLGVTYSNDTQLLSFARTLAFELKRVRRFSRA
jgi:hypothetical protein